MGAILAAVRIAIDVALRPVGAEQHPAASRDTTMLRFPVLDVRVAQQEVGIDRAFGGEVEHHRGSAKLLRGDLVNAIVGKRSEEHTSELQSLMRISYAVFCLKKKLLIKLIYLINIQLT